MPASGQPLAIRCKEAMLVWHWLWDKGLGCQQTDPWGNERSLFPSGAAHHGQPCPGEPEKE